MEWVNVRSALLVTLSFFCILFNSSNVRAEWIIETVDSSVDVGEFSSLALDSYANPHISYFNNPDYDLKYASFNGGAWQIETVDSEGMVGEQTSLALDSSGNPYISYVDENYGSADFKYARFNGSNWQIQKVDTSGDVGWQSSLKLDKNGSPHISYMTGLSYDLKYAFFNGGAWQIETVDGESLSDDVGWNTSLALDKEGNPHISYYDFTHGALKYASFNGSGWQVETVDDTSPDTGRETSLALDSKGNPHISYCDFTNRALKYATFDGSWAIETVESSEWGAEDTSIALDTSGNPHISYIGIISVNPSTSYGLRYASFDGSTWKIETVDSSDVKSSSTSLVLDADGRPHISYYAGVLGNLRYAFLSSSLPTTTTTALGTTTTTTITPRCPVEELYGNDSEETELLRYLRDNVLSKTLEGQELIRLYYEWSPVIVKAMENDEQFRQEVKEMIEGILEVIK